MSPSNDSGKSRAFSQIIASALRLSSHNDIIYFRSFFTPLISLAFAPWHAVCKAK